jgi:hypothetical protein
MSFIPKGSRDISVATVTRPQADPSGNPCSTPGNGKKLICLNHSASYSIGTKILFSGGKKAEA